MYQFNDILTSLIFIILHFGLFLINYKIFAKKFFQPVVLFSFLWFAIVSLHFILSFTILDELVPLNINTYWIFFIGAICFSLGGFLVQATSQRNATGINVSAFAGSVADLNISLKLRIIFTAIIILGLPFYIQATYRVFLASQIDDFFAGVRTAITYYEEDIGPTKYLLSFSFVVFGINLYSFFKAKTKINKLILYICLIVTLAYAVLATGRTFFLMILAIYMGISYMQGRRTSIRKYILLFFGFIVFFMGIGIFWGKSGDKRSSLTENIKVSTEVTATYLVLSLSALDNETTHHQEINYKGENTLRFFVKIAQQINLMPNKKVTNLVKEFLFIPYGTNVYTFYSDYIKDFGKLYAWFMIMLFGALHTWLHNKASKTRTFRYAIYFSFLLYPLLISFFQDGYMTLFSTWLQVIFYVEVFLVLNKLFVLKKW